MNTNERKCKQNRTLLQLKAVQRKKKNSLMAENNRNCFFKYIKSQDKAKKKIAANTAQLPNTITCNNKLNFHF